MAAATPAPSANYPLRDSWQFWVRLRDARKKGNQSGQDWQKDLQPIGEPVRTVADFWAGLHAALQQEASNFFMFQEGVQPAWEDPHFANGGSVNLTFSGPDFSDSARGGFILCCCLLIGGHFDSELVRGATIGQKSANCRVELWLSDDDGTVLQNIADRALTAAAQVHYEFFKNPHTKISHEGKAFRGGGDRRARGEEVSIERIVADYKK